MPHPDFWPLGQNKPGEKSVQDESLFLKNQLGFMEGEVKEIQMELASIRKDRLDLYNRKSFKEDSERAKDKNGHIELYEGDRSKYFSDVSKLRTDLIRAQNSADEERFQRLKNQERLKDLDSENINTNVCKTDDKESRKMDEESEQSSLRAKLRDTKEELEDMKLVVTEKSEQLQEYRVKYLQAEQQAEEYRRQLDAQEYDNKQISDQIQFEIQKMKMQFQEKLQELSPLPELLKGSQLQLQEAKQLQRLAEDSCQQLSNELQRTKEKLVVSVNNLNKEKLESKQLFEDNMLLKATLDERQTLIQNLEKEAEDNKFKLLRVEEKLKQEEHALQEKAKECGQLVKDISELRSEGARALTRSKERTDSMRRYLQTQISELERQLIQSRAQSKACHKERDELRQRMQVQVGNLQEDFELVEIRLRALQNQVSSLKGSVSAGLDSDEDGAYLVAS